MNKNEIYFVLFLTESEHSFVESDIKEYCDKNDLQLKYYREFKYGHIPMYREVKIVGRNINKFKKFLKDKMITDSIIPIPKSARISPEEGKRRWNLIKEQYKESNPILYNTLEEEYKGVN
jgi:hypothetical protein